MKKHYGLTLIEMMIAMSIGLAVTGGFISVFVSNSQTSRLQYSVEEIQENARFVLDRIVNSAHNAEYQGCYSGSFASMENLLNDQNNFLWNLTNPVQGFNNVSVNTVVGGLSGFFVNSDVLVVKRISNSALLTANSSSDAISASSDNHQFMPGEVMVVSNCSSASVFQTTALVDDDQGTITLSHAVNATDTPGNNLGNMGNLYRGGAEIGKLETILYFIKTGANGRPALMEASVQPTGMQLAVEENELIANVDNMQIIYGEDTNDDKNVDVYRDASAVIDWDNVISFEIALLMSSEENSGDTEKNSYSFDQANFTYTRDAIPANDADYRLRRVVTAFGSLRNRTL